MKYLSPLLLFIFLIPFYGSAQSNYKPGYVVSTKGDTLRGFINYKEWEYNPQKIEFKTSTDAAAKTEYSTDNAKAFGITGFELYTNFTLAISRDQVEYSNLSQGIDTSTVTRTAFFKIVATGKYVTLYSYTDRTKQRFFIAETGEQPVELRYHVYIDADGLNHVSTDAGYKKQLLKLAAKYQPKPELYTEIQQADYKYADIVKTINGINGINGLTVEQIRTSKPGSVFFITAGLTNSSLKLSKTSDPNDIPASTSLFPQIGVGINLYLNKDVGRLVFRSELYFTGSKTNFNYSYDPEPGQSAPTYTEMMSFKMYRVALAPQILYNVYNAPQFKFFLSAGVNAQLHFYSDKQYTITTQLAGSDFSQQGLFPYTYIMTATGIAKAGVVINNRIELYALYLPPTELLKDAYDMRMTQYGAGLSYLFGKP